MLARFEREVDPDGKLPPEIRARRADFAKRAYFAKLAMKSSRARRERSVDSLAMRAEIKQYADRSTEDFTDLDDL